VTTLSRYIRSSRKRFWATCSRRSSLVAATILTSAFSMRVPPTVEEPVLPRVHLVFSLLKRWLMSTHQGAVRHSHLDYYLDEFPFCFNRRTSASRGKLFYRLIEQAAAIPPQPYRVLRSPAVGPPPLQDEGA